jgi:hypothetical protein
LGNNAASTLMQTEPANVAFGTTRNATNAIFCFFPPKVCFTFLKCQNRFFRRLPKWQLESREQHFITKIQDLHVASFRSALVSIRKPLRYLLNFVQARGYFAGSGSHLGINNSKNQKNTRPSCGIILCDLVVSKYLRVASFYVT